MKKTTLSKNCTCHTCVKDFHHQGIATHRAMHRDKKENCKITYTNGETYVHEYAESEEVPDSAVREAQADRIAGCQVWQVKKNCSDSVGAALGLYALSKVLRSRRFEGKVLRIMVPYSEQSSKHAPNKRWALRAILLFTSEYKTSGTKDKEASNFIVTFFMWNEVYQYYG